MRVSIAATARRRRGLGADLSRRMRQLDDQAKHAFSLVPAERREPLQEFRRQHGELSTLLRTQILPAARAQGLEKLSGFRRLARQTFLALAFMAAVAGLIGAMAAIVLLRGVLYPLTDILTQTQALASAPQGSLIDMSGDDELGQLAEAINMALEQRQARGLAMEKLAHLDPLTALPNRRLFSDRLEEMIEHARRLDRQVAVYVIDIDNFKDLNDTLGHAAGDSLLLQMGARLQQVSRDTDIVARLGGDEFAIIRTNINQSDGVTRFAGRIIQAMTEAYEINGIPLHSTASIGITIYPDDVKDSAQLLQHAELALYRAKEEGRGRFQLFDSAMHAAVQKRHALERELRVALQEGQLEIHYQPRYQAGNRSIVGAEALIRWQHPHERTISPAEFIPVAESSGLITELTEIVLSTASRQMAIWSEEFARPMIISVKLSPVDFRRADIVQFIDQTLKNAQLAPTQLEIEITEGLVMHGAELVRGRLAEIHELGVSLAIDDFGTGFSSMSYLKEFPFDALKIDQSFVAGIPDQQADAAITIAIIRLAQSLNLTTIAEGVETEAQFAFLAKRDCDQVQGFLLSRPVTEQAFRALLEEDQ